MRATYFLTTLILMLAISGCASVEAPEQATAATTRLKASEQAAVATASLEVTEEATATTAPLAAPKQTATVAAPVTTPRPVSGGDAGQIYAAAIRQMYSVDHSFDEPSEFPLVYIVTATDDGTLLDAPATSPQNLAPELRQSIEAELTDLSFEIIWVESLQEVPVERSSGKIAEGQGIYITLGNILPQDDGTVQLPFYMLCGSLCISGKIYVLGEVDGAWQVTGSVGPEIMG